MEEPPKIERIISSQGISLADTATILKSYLSNIDQFHHNPEAQPLDIKEETATPSKGGGDDGADENATKKERKSRQEREEESWIAQMDQLANNKLSSGMISDDVYERLKMITKSICAEVEGEPYSASGMAAMAATKSESDAAGKNNDLGGGQNDDAAAEGFLAELERAERLERQEKQLQQLRPQPRTEQTKRDKKKEKKAKKAAKKAKKDAKRKSKEMDNVDGSTPKKAKVES